MEDKEILGLISIIFAVIGFGKYIRDILKNETHPHAFSWVVWGLLGAVAFFAQRSEAAGAGSWATGAGAMACLVIAALSVFYGERTITKSDWLFFLSALVTIPLWAITGDPLWSVILAATIDTVGFFPTFRKAYEKPKEETAFLFVTDTFKFGCSIFAMERYSMTNLFYPVVIIAFNVIFVSMLVWRRRKQEPVLGVWVR